MRPPSDTDRLPEVALLFLKLGTLAFGGPAAHIAMMQEEVVRRKNWISQEEFLDLIGAVNLIPGPNSTELAIHIGYRRAGWAGLWVAGICFILPAMCLVMAIAWAYVRFGSLPRVDGLLYGIKPVVIAIIAQAFWALGRSALKSPRLAILAAAAAAGAFAGANEVAVLAATGAAALFTGPRGTETGGMRTAAATPIWMGAGLSSLSGAFGAAQAAAFPFSMTALFLFFLKVGSVLFGSGYVLLAFLRTQLVERWHWLTEGQLLDAMAVGQFTPGPVFTTATFIGFLLQGPYGALLATAGIFLPAFFFVAVSGPLISALRGSPRARGFLDGVNAASLALLAVVLWHLARSALVDGFTLSLTAAAAFLLLRMRIHSGWLILGGALLGAAFHSPPG